MKRSILFVFAIVALFVGIYGCDNGEDISSPDDAVENASGDVPIGGPYVVADDDDDSGNDVVADDSGDDDASKPSPKKAPAKKNATSGNKKSSKLKIYAIKIGKVTLGESVDVAAKANKASVWRLEGANELSIDTRDCADEACKKVYIVGTPTAAGKGNVTIFATTPDGEEANREVAYEVVDNDAEAKESIPAEAPAADEPVSCDAPVAFTQVDPSYTFTLSIESPVSNTIPITFKASGGSGAYKYTVNKTEAFTYEGLDSSVEMLQGEGDTMKANIVLTFNDSFSLTTFPDGSSYIYEITAQDTSCPGAEVAKLNYTVDLKLDDNWKFDSVEYLFGAGMDDIHKKYTKLDIGFLDVNGDRLAEGDSYFWWYDDGPGRQMDNSEICDKLSDMGKDGRGSRDDARPYCIDQDDWSLKWTGDKDLLAIKTAYVKHKAKGKGRHEELWVFTLQFRVAGESGTNRWCAKVWYKDWPGIAAINNSEWECEKKTCDHTFDVNWTMCEIAEEDSEWKID